MSTDGLMLVMIGVERVRSTVGESVTDTERIDSSWIGTGSTGGRGWGKTWC